MKGEWGVPRHACWLAQQAAEKALKAILVFASIEPPRSHDLDLLRNLAPAGWQLKTSLSDLAELSQWAVEARYPRDWTEVALPHAAQAVNQARQVIAAVVDRLVRHGFPEELA